MNIEIRALVNYSGEIDGLTPILEGFANVLIEEGYGSDGEKDQCRSIILVRETEIGSFPNAEKFLSDAVKQSLLVALPFEKEETDDSTGD